MKGQEKSFILLDTERYHGIRGRVQRWRPIKAKRSLQPKRISHQALWVTSEFCSPSLFLYVRCFSPSADWPLEGKKKYCFDTCMDLPVTSQCPREGIDWFIYGLRHPYNLNQRQGSQAKIAQLLWGSYGWQRGGPSLKEVSLVSNDI